MKEHRRGDKGKDQFNLPDGAHQCCIFQRECAEPGDRPQHTGNPGLLDIPGWQDMPLTQAAQAVQRSGFPDAYAQWEDVAGDITDLLGGDLPDLPDVDGAVSNAR